MPDPRFSRVGLEVSNPAMECLVGAVGIELKAVLKPRKLLILRIPTNQQIRK